MAESLGILINTGFNIDTKKLQTELGTLQKDTKLKLDIQFDTKQLDSFKSKIDSVGKSLNNNYWQGRFTESIKDMTAIDSELVKMKQFYQEQEKVASATEKRIQKEKQVEQSLKQQLADFKKYAELRSKNIENRYGNISSVKENLSSYSKELSNIVVQNGKLINSNTGLETSFGRLRQGLSNIQLEARNSTGLTAFISNLKDSIEKFGSWMITGTLTMQTINQFKSAISYLNDMDKYLTNVRLITGETAEEVSNLTNEYTRLGKELGAVSTSVAEIAEGFYRQGKSASETQQLIKDTTMMAQLSGLGTTEAQEYMTSIMNGFNVEVSGMTDVVSKLVAVDNSAATSVAELSEALSKTASVANSVGVNLDDLMGYIATVSETTRQDAGSIGKRLCRYVQKCA